MTSNKEIRFEKFGSDYVITMMDRKYVMRAYNPDKVGEDYTENYYDKLAANSPPRSAKQARRLRIAQILALVLFIAHAFVAFGIAIAICTIKGILP